MKESGETRDSGKRAEAGGEEEEKLVLTHLRGQQLTKKSADKVSHTVLWTPQIEL